MANNWAIAIGINTYEHLPQSAHLRYAAKDAVLLRDFLAKTAGFPTGQILLCTDGSAPVGNLSTRPTRSNLRRLLREELIRAKGADNLCFYFSGHGMAGSQGDYFLPADGNPNDLHDTAVSVHFVTECLRKCQAKNVVLILDMCRNEGRDENAKAIGNTVGQQIINIAKQQGIVTMFSCERGQRSYEIPALGYGAFTYSLVNGLKQHNVLRQLEQYLYQEMPKLGQQYGCAVPIPKLIPEPGWKYDALLIEGYTTEADVVDVGRLIDQAKDAEIDENFETARQLWWQVIEHGSRAKIREARVALDRIRGKEMRLGMTSPPPQPAPSPTAFVAQPEVKAAAPAQPTVQPTPPTDKPLPERYRALEQYLKNSEWKKADNETYRLMITKVGKKAGDWFTKDELLNFDCEELLTIDDLWVKHSNGKFGFSVQKELYVECGGILDGECHEEAWDRFCDKNGWQEDDKYLDIQFETNSPKAHLPAVYGGLCGDLAVCDVGGECIFSCIQTCKSTRYRVLENYLKNGEWEKADDETYRLMITKVGKKQGEWFTQDELLNFDCEELLTIDDLWVKYSNGKFGFSVQKELYVECGGILDGEYHRETWVQFCHKNGWQANGNYVLKFEIESPKAHLPIVGGWFVFGWGRLLIGCVSGGLWILFSRIQTCKV